MYKNITQFKCKSFRVSSLNIIRKRIKIVCFRTACHSCEQQTDSGSSGDIDLNPDDECSR